MGVLDDIKKAKEYVQQKKLEAEAYGEMKRARTSQNLQKEEAKLKAEYAVYKQKQKVEKLKAKMRPPQNNKSFMMGSSSKGITLGNGTASGSAFKGSIGSGTGTFVQRKRKEWKIG